MLLALVGSHGTGKSTVFEEIKKRHPEHQYFAEAVRHLVPAFGYDDPYQIIEEVGVAAFELMNINYWSVIDPEVNTVLDLDRHIITDRSALDNYAYYLTLRKTELDFAAAKLMSQMVKHYMSKPDRFVYFPVGAFPLERDEMRPDNLKFWEDVDNNIKRGFDEFDIPKDKIHYLQSVDLEERVDEVISLIR